MKKGVIGIIISIFLLIVLAVFVKALIFSNDLVDIQSPGSDTNNSGVILFNVTYTNGTGITNPHNVTFFINSTTSIPINNSGAPSDVLNGTCTLGSCYISLHTGNITDGIYSINASLDNGTDQYVINSTANFSNYVIFDNTPPIVFDANFSSSVATGINYSGSDLLLNISVVDVTAGIRAVMFNITNVTSNQNITFIAVREGSTANYRTYLNTTGFADGLYNITAFVNDTTTGGNLNNSAKVQLIRFDNTPPMVFNSNFTSIATETNYSGSNLLLNISLFDVTSGIRAVIFNITNATSEQNITFIAIRDGSSLGYRTFLNTTGFADGLYNVSAIVNDTTTGGNLNNSAVTQLIRFDNTVPRVNISSLSLGTNLTSTNQSGSFVVNVSASDVTSGIRAVMLNITNATGTQNGTYVLTREGSTVHYSKSINTAHFPDGFYNITARVNDTTSGGNVNGTEKVHTIAFDRTAPVVSFSCTPNPVNEGATLTCSCSGTDATSGVKTTSFTANPSTSQTGTFTTTCTITDHAGNSAAANYEYTVSGVGSSSSGGSSGSGRSTTSGSGPVQASPPTPTTVPSSGGTTNLGENEETTFNSKILKVTSVSGNSATVVIDGTSRQLTIGESAEVGDMKVTLVSITSEGKAELKVEPVQAITTESIPAAPETSSNSLAIVIVLIILIVIAIVAYYVIKRRKQ